PLDDHLEVGERLPRAHHADRLAGAEQHARLPGPGIGVPVDAGEVALAERAPSGPDAVDERPRRLLRGQGGARHEQDRERTRRVSGGETMHANLPDRLRLLEMPYPRPEA